MMLVNGSIPDFRYPNDVILTAATALVKSDTADAADSKSIQLASGGAAANTRGGYLATYGNEHATLPGVWQLVAGTTSTQTYLLGGGAANTIMRIYNQTSDAADSGVVQISGGGAANDTTRGAYIHLHGNEHSTQPGHVVIVAGAPATPGQIKILTSKLVVAATATGAASINIPTGTAPSSPSDGDVWREDNTNTGLKVRINGVTKTFTVA